MQNKVRTNSKVAQAPSTAIAVPLPLGGRLMLQPHNPSVCHPERSRSFGEGVSRCAATIRSKTEERSDEGISFGVLLSVHMM